jgi:hypothetical protein
MLFVCDRGNQNLDAALIHNHDGVVMLNRARHQIRNQVLQREVGTVSNPIHQFCCRGNRLSDPQPATDEVIMSTLSAVRTQRATSIRPANDAHIIMEAIETAINLVYLARESQTLDDADVFLGNAEEQLMMIAVLVSKIPERRFVQR